VFRAFGRGNRDRLRITVESYYGSGGETIED
jgi:hypothetical protein